MTICVDIWGGEGSQDHVARYMLPIDKALDLARSELADGFLVNLRTEAVWGVVMNFDTRKSS
jgi:hypothetical protein